MDVADRSELPTLGLLRLRAMMYGPATCPEPLSGLTRTSRADYRPESTAVATAPSVRVVLLAAGLPAAQERNLG
jgi:hypothetical protein